MTAENEITVHHLRLENAALPEGTDFFDKQVDTEQLAAFIADRGHKMVFATSCHHVVGMASGTVLLHPDKRPAFFINEVGVHEDMRCLGIGTKLVQLLIEEARNSGCEGIWLATESDTIEARALYRKLDAGLTESPIWLNCLKMDHLPA